MVRLKCLTWYFKWGFVARHFSTKWAVWCKLIHRGCFCLRSIVFVQFNQLANVFYALEMNYKSKTKKHVLIIISKGPLPWLVTAPVQSENQQHSCREQEGIRGTLKNPIRTARIQSLWQVECYLKGRKRTSLQLECIVDCPIFNSL